MAASGKLCPGIPLALPSGPYLPVRAPNNICIAAKASPTAYTMYKS